MVVEMGRLCSGCRPAICTEALGDIASANYFYLRTLCMDYCAFQHIKSPVVAHEEARHRKVTGLHVACIMQASVH